MGGARIAGFAAVAAIAAFLAGGAALAFSDIPESESKLIVHAQKLGMVRTQTKLGGSSGTRAEYAVLENRQKVSWISIYLNEAHPGMYFRSADTNPKDAAKMFTFYAQNKATFERDGRSGGTRYVMAVLPDRECVLITHHAGVTDTDRASADGTTLVLYVNYCLPSGEKATGDSVTQVMANIGVRGRFDPK